MRRMRWVYGVAAGATLAVGALSEQACSGTPSVSLPAGMAVKVTKEFTGDGGACSGPIGSIAPPSCDPSDNNAAGCRSTKSNGCTYDKKCGDTTTCEPFVQNPPLAEGVDNFRMRLIQITAPPPLATLTVQKSIVTLAVDLPSSADAGGAACGESGNGLFNWLITVDAIHGTVKTGGAPPSTDPFGLGYCYLNGTVANKPVGPITSTATFSGNTFSTPSFPGKLNIPIFLAPSGVVVLPITAGSLEKVTVSPDGNCIGSLNVNADTKTSCNAPLAVSGADSCSRWHSDGALEGYITLDDADTVIITTFNVSLCSFLTGTADGQTLSHCTTAGKKMGDYCSDTKKACTGGDSFWLSATFAASAVNVTEGKGVSLCNGGSVGGIDGGS